MGRDPAAQLGAAGADGGKRGEVGDDPGLHVASTPSVDHASGDPRYERIPAPLGWVAGRYNVHVPLQDQARPVTSTRGDGGQPPRLVPRRLGARKLGIRAQPGQIHRPQIDLEPQCLQAGGQDVLQLRFSGAAGDARDGQQFQQRGGDGRLVDRG